MMLRLSVLLVQMTRPHLSVATASRGVGVAASTALIKKRTLSLEYWRYGVLQSGASSVALGGTTHVSVRLQRQSLKAASQHSALARRVLYRFFEALLGGSCYFILCRNLQQRLAIAELAQVYTHSQRIFALMPASLLQIRRVVTYPWAYGATALYLAVILRDPQLLVAWLQSRISAMTLFQHRRFFRTLALSLATAVTAPSGRYALRGLRLSVVGKLSVTGNAMTRTYAMRVGHQSNASVGLRLTQAFTIVRTRTGCLGVTLGFYF
jgi:hypothetical protein